jgi:uncharacterized protein YggE
MKKIIFILIAALFMAPGMAQENKPVQKTISVTGTSEIEVVPDQIYVQVDLREYTKKNGDKIDITSIRNNFLSACKSIGLADSDVTIQGYQGYDNSYWWWKKKKQDPDMKAGITYWVKVSKVSMLDALVDKMDDEATQNFSIVKTAYSQIDRVTKDMKIAAVKAARDKAAYLAEAIGEYVGEAVTINEPVQINVPPRPLYATMKTGMVEDNTAPPMDVDFNKIKIQFEVNVVFSLR